MLAPYWAGPIGLSVDKDIEENEVQNNDERTQVCSCNMKGWNDKVAAMMRAAQ